MLSRIEEVEKSGIWVPSLKEIENHIKDKRHLSGIPSAAEVKSKGIDLGEMNAKLLQKIEELTLYLIDQNKRLEQQEQKIKKLSLINHRQKKH